MNARSILRWRRENTEGRRRRKRELPYPLLASFSLRSSSSQGRSFPLPSPLARFLAPFLHFFPRNIDFFSIFPLPAIFLRSSTIQETSTVRSISSLAVEKETEEGGREGKRGTDRQRFAVITAVSWREEAGRTVRGATTGVERGKERDRRGEKFLREKRIQR